MGHVVNGYGLDRLSADKLDERRIDADMEGIIRLSLSISRGNYIIGHNVSHKFTPLDFTFGLLAQLLALFGVSLVYVGLSGSGRLTLESPRRVRKERSMEGELASAISDRCVSLRYFVRTFQAVSWDK